MKLVLPARTLFILAPVMGCIFIALPLFAGQMNAPAVSTTLVISQFQVGGTASSADEFIELHNIGLTPIDLNGYRLVYRSATGSTDVSVVSWSASLILNQGCFYLIAETPGYTGIVTPDLTYAGGTLSSVAGGLALRYGALNTGTVIDSVGYGSTVTNTFVEMSPTVAPPANQSAARKNFGSVDTDNNKLDFELLNPSLPHNTTVGNGCTSTSPTPTPTATATPVPAPGSILIAAALFNGYQGNADEGIELMNVSNAAQNISGWNVTNNIGAVSFPTATLNPGQRIWIANQATAFKMTFGFLPDFEYGGDTDPNVPQMSGSAPLFSDSGGEIVLRDNSNVIRDALVYMNGNASQSGWSGAAVQPYNVFPLNDATQVFYRKLNETTGYPISDTNSANDWAQTKACAVTLYGPVRDCDIDGKKHMAPGWATGIISPTQLPTDNWVTFKATETANLSILAAPDNIYAGYISALNTATSTIFIEGYQMHNPGIVNALKARAQAGVQIKILMEGEPCCTGQPDQGTLWAMKEISSVAPSAQIFFMSDLSTTNGITVTYHHDRYDSQHAKFTLIDAGLPGQVLLTGTENFNCDSMPPDNKANGTSGNRGYYVKTNAPAVIAKYLAIFNQDRDANHDDIVELGTAPYAWDGSTVPSNCSDGTFYPVQKPAPLDLSGTFRLEVVQCPDNCLHYDESLLGMVRRAGAGDLVLVEQAYERKYWGSGAETPPFTDPNPRLEAYIEAAR
ncbi:MAG TPA: lamin tail domain-containing protein, partial [Anaerolineae bacterium]